MKPRKKLLTQSQRLSKIAVLSACFCFFYFDRGCAAIASDYFDLSPEQLLGARVLSASKKEEKVAAAAAAVYVITQEDIARSGLTSIPELLRLAPGVEVARENSNSWAITIRGFNSTSANKILVMIDDRTVYNPFFSGTLWQLQDQPLEDIERIEVIRGPGGALWGANAVNGVINIITKSAKATQGGLVSAGGGNYERDFGAARYGAKMGEDSYYRVYGKFNDRGPLRNTAENGDAHDDWQSYHTGFRMDWNGKGGPDSFSLHGDAYRVNADQLNQSFFFTAPFSTTTPETVGAVGQNITGLWNHKYGDGSSLKLQSYIDYTSFSEILVQDHRVMFDNDVQYNFAPMGRNEITVGGNYRLTSDNIGGSNEITFNPPSLTQNLFGVFGQDKITLAPKKWFLTLGAKLEHDDYTGFEFQPDGRLEWLPDSTQTVWASVSRAVRTPSREERDLDIANLIVGPGVIFPAFPTEIQLAENKDYRSEDLIAYEIGYRKQVTPDIAVDTSVFANDYRKLATDSLLNPSFIPAGADPAHFVVPLQQVNGKTAEVYGAELAVSWKVNSRWKLSGSYSLLEMFLHSPTILGFSQETDEGRSPKSQFNVRSYWDITDRWSLDTMAYYVDQLPADRVPAYVRLDMNLGWKVSKGLQFNLIGQNLFTSPRREFGPATGINTTEAHNSIFGKFTWQF